MRYNPYLPLGAGSSPAKHTPLSDAIPMRADVNSVCAIDTQEGKYALKQKVSALSHSEEHWQTKSSRCEMIR
jgi:hypothetical protein